MLMTPGTTFTGPSGFSYSSSGQEIEIGPADVRLALINGWVGQPYGLATGLGYTPQWIKVGNKINFSEFSAAALTSTINLFMLAPHGILHGIKIRHTTAFSGPAISAYTISVGHAGNASYYASAFNVFQAPSSQSYQLSSNFAGEDALVATQITATATAVGANLNVATAGVVDIWALLSVDP